MKILAADGISAQGIEILKPDFEVDIRDKISHEELLEIIPQFDALMVRSASKVTADVIERAENLKIIGRAGVGVDNIDVQAATSKGILVINSPGGNTIAATEHTCAMMLALARKIPIANQTMQAGEWNRKKYVGVELNGKTLGVIGMGRIGAGVAKRAIAFGMEVLGYDPYINEERANSIGVKIATLDELIEKSDFITVHMPLTDETRGMISMPQMKRMKNSVRLINCARGGIINEQDLAQAVKDGIVAGAAIDVFTEEPIPKDHPLIGVDNIILTPHLGASTVEAQIGVSVDVAEGIRAALNGEPVAAINMPSISQQAMRVISPYLTLAENLGHTVASLAEGAIKNLKVTFNGEITKVNTKLLTTAVVKGMLNPVMEKEVNYVNAPGIAKERNIKITETNDNSVEDFSNLITVEVSTGDKIFSAQGTLFGSEGRIVEIDGFRVDVDPRARILICPHVNRPGIIGKVGTLLGGNKINISGMQVGKTEVEGRSLMVLTIDNPIPNEVLKEFKSIDGIFDAKLVDFSSN